MAGNPIRFTLHPTLNDIMPDFNDINSIVLLLTFVFLFIGIEMTASHTNEIDQLLAACKNYHSLNTQL